MRLIALAAMFSVVAMAEVPFAQNLTKDGANVRIDKGFTLPITDPEYSGKDGVWLTISTGRLFVTSIRISIAARLSDGTTAVRTRELNPVYIGKQYRVYFPVGTVDQVQALRVEQITQPVASEF
jgi:hypothetical protein